MKDSYNFYVETLIVCSNTTLLKLQTVLFLLFSKFCASKSGVWLIYGCGLYTGVYGNLNRVKDEFIAGVATKSKVEKRDQGIL